MNSPTLLQIVPSPARGGCEEYALTIAREAVTRGWNVHAAMHGREALASLRADYQRAGVHCHMSRLETLLERPHAPRAVLASAMRTSRLIRSLRPRVVQLVLPWPTFGLGPMLACAGLKVPLLVVFQLVLEATPLARPLSLAYSWARTRCQRWVAVSKNNRSLLSTVFRVPAEEISLIYNGAELPPLPRVDGAMAARESICEELGIPLDAFLLLGVGRLSHQKGFDTLIEAAARVVAATPAAHVVIAGDGPDREALGLRAQALGLSGRVHLLGQRWDVPRLLAAVDQFVFPSRGEGHPFALVEAMGAGLPVVATDVSGIGELITHGSNGLLVCPDSADSLANAMLRLARSPQDSYLLGQRAAQTARLFSAERMVNETLEAMVQLSESPRRRSAVASLAVRSAPLRTTES